MKRQTAVLSIMVALLLASLVAFAAVGGSSATEQKVVPQFYREETSCYFRFIFELPEQVSSTSREFEVRVIEGEAWLVNAQPLLAGTERPVVAGDGRDEHSSRELEVTGRCRGFGQVRLEVMGRDAGDSARALANISFNIPPGGLNVPDVRRSWALQQQRSLESADPHGKDSYSYYWNLAIAPRFGIAHDQQAGIMRLRREPPDLYSIFTGAAAIQESLQLELLGYGPLNASQQEVIQKSAGSPEYPVLLTDLKGPAVKSHPFKEMLKGKNPQLPALASFIPEDQYAVFFSDINRQIELADLMDEWGGNLLHQVETSARDFKVREKVSRQLCLENSWLTRMFGDRVVAGMAFTGHDPFLKEGTAFTVLFSLKEPDRFRKQIKKSYAEAARGRGAKLSFFTVNGLNGISAVSPDRGISSYTLITGSTAIVSNSLPALQRIADVSAGRIPSLARADDFRYMRTIFPQNAAEEDIFIYLSDAHIRNLVGPRWKIGEARRMRCSANMGLLANARLWFKAENRREPSLTELASGGYLGKIPPICPDHGSYAIDKDGQPHCSLHNRQGQLTPVGEVPLEQVTQQEAAQYKAFVENYNRFWTQFFDPIGIRIKMGKEIRIQTCILPLIENSWYDGMVAFSGRSPGLLTESAVLPRTIMSLRGHMSDAWLKQTGLPQKVAGRNLKLDWLGDELALNLCDGQVLFSAGGSAMGLMGRGMGRSSLEPLVIGYLGSALNLPTYLTVKVTDSTKAEQAIPSLFRALAPGHGRNEELSVETYSIEEHGGKRLYVANFNLWVLKLRLYSAVVDDRLVIASRRDIVTDLMDASVRGARSKVVRQEGNMELSLYRSAFKQLEETVSLGWQEDLRHACHQNLPLAGILLKSLGLSPDSLASEIFSLRGYQPYCPSGGHYLLDQQTGVAACSIHGTRRNPRQPPAGDKSSQTFALVNSLERISARLAFTPEGLMTTVDIKRKEK